MASRSKRPGRKRRPRSARISSRRARDPLIGYFAREGRDICCDGDACIIAGSREEMARILGHYRRGQNMTIQATTLAEILCGMQQYGGAYCFDEQAYHRFLPLARDAGMPLAEQDFSDPGPLGMHFVRVQWLIPDRPIDLAWE